MLNKPVSREVVKALPPAFRVHFQRKAVNYLAHPGHFPHAKRGGKQLFYEGHIYRLDGSRVATEEPHRIASRLLELYEQEGEAVFPGVIGEFTVTVIDDDEIVAYRNLTSPFQIYYSESHLSNHLLPLASLQKRLDLSEDYLLRFLIRREPLLYQNSRTPFKGISRLAAGHVLRASAHRSPTTTFIEHRNFSAKTDYQQKAEDVAPRLQEVMSEVVQDRLDRFADRPIVCQLSGGLDSSYLCSLLGRSTQRVKAIMYSYPDNPSHRFSETCASAVAEKYNLEFKILPPETFLPFDLSSLEVSTDEPSHFSWQGAVFATKLASLIEDSSVIFCGSGSDQLFYRQPHILPWLLKRGDLRAYFKTLAECGRSIQRSSANLFYQSLLASIPSYMYSPFISFMERLPVNLISFEDVSSEFILLDVVSWIRSETAGNVARLQRNILEEESLEHKKLFGKDAEIRSPLCGVTEPQMSFVPFAQGKNLDYQLPYSDLRLLEFVYQQVSWHLIYDWKNPYKHLLREAQKGVVPEITRTRKKNEFHFCGFLDRLLRDNQHYLRRLLVDNDLLGLNLFDEREIIATFEKMLFGFDNNSSRSLLGLISYLIWLDNFKCAHTKAVKTGEYEDLWDGGS